ncbi:uncharacterized protein FA14DRAFT_160996 [Meira miltonrushii]|uniref:Uncharacterized protein n=1 Tax=Meira miltonrushii TaxID=1280837 RepID=A0A316VF28_9BASI|nr:uncharacterized protein FA14DRAFT_160996 [Meira miltonrushii]PWN36140.1 hypothetical protein FA14DRAFT_160996 [Meira miltonrushii]
MMRFTVFPLVAIATIFGIAFAGPISLEERSSGLSCGPVLQTTDKLGYGDSTGGYPRFTLGKKVDEHGQWQVTQLEDGAETLNVNIRGCNSTYLGLYSNTNDEAVFMNPYGYVSFGKIFLAEDNSKCLQRHETLPSSDPNKSTHITVEECSNDDDATQARQFWYFQDMYNTANPLIKATSGDMPFIPLDIFLSNTSPPALITSRKNAGAPENAINLS